MRSLLFVIFFLVLVGLVSGLEFKVVSEKHSIIEHEVVLEVKGDNEFFDKFFYVKSKNIVSLNAELESDDVETKSKIKKSFSDFGVVKEKNKEAGFVRINDLATKQPKLLQVNFKTKPEEKYNAFFSSGSYSINPSYWWDNAWLYRLTIDFNSSGNDTNHNILVILDKNTAGFINSGRKSDCSDFRFTDSNNDKELKHFVAYCDVNKAWVWFKTNVNVGANKVFLYYGNPSASSTSDFNNTFVKVDDFEDGTLTNPNWSGSTGQFSATNKYVQVTAIGAGNIDLTTPHTNYPKKSGAFFYSVVSPLKQASVQHTNGSTGDLGLSFDITDVDTNIVFRCRFCSTINIYNKNISPVEFRKAFFNVSKDGNVLVTLEKDSNVFVNTSITSEATLNSAWLGKNGFTGALVDNIYVGKTTQDINISTQKIPAMSRFTKYNLYDGNNYFKTTAYYETTADCNNETIKVDLNEGNSLLNTSSFSCNGTKQTKEFYYNMSGIGWKTLTLSTYSNNVLVDSFSQLFYFDNVSPSINYSTKYVGGGDLNVSLTCYDNYTKNKYVIKHNNIVDYNQVRDVNLTITITASLNDGLNVISVSCEDISGNKSEQTTDVKLYKKKYYFVYNNSGTALTNKTDYVLADVNKLYVFDLDSNSITEMFDSGKVSYDKTTINSSASLFFNITYNSSPLITIRNDFDVDVIQDANIPVCFEKLQPIYEQRFVSSSKRKVILQNNTTKCYYFGSRTKYSYNDFYYVGTYITPASYDLWVENDDGNMEKISLVLGDQAQQINLDSLLLINKQYQVNLNGELISARFSCATDCNLLTINYLNTKYDNNSLKISVHKDLTEIYSVQLDDSNVNKAILVLDTSSWDINNSTIEIRATSRKQNGETNIVRFYYHTVLRPLKTPVNSWLAVVGAILMFGIGFTIVHPRVALGWFGIIIILVSLFITSFAKQEWYVVLLQAILLIIGLYVMLLYKDESRDIT